MSDPIVCSCFLQLILDSFISNRFYSQTDNKEKLKKSGHDSRSDSIW